VVVVLLSVTPWNFYSVRQNIRNGHPDYIVTADAWPAFLFPHARVNDEEVEDKLFKSAILVKVSSVTLAQGS
jgi:hypothetical protein